MREYLDRVIMCMLMKGCVWKGALIICVLIVKVKVVCFLIICVLIVKLYIVCVAGSFALPVASTPAPTMDGGPEGRSEAVTGITIFPEGTCADACDCACACDGGG